MLRQQAAPHGNTYLLHFGHLSVEPRADRHFQSRFILEIHSLFIPSEAPEKYMDGNTATKFHTLKPNPPLGQEHAISLGLILHLGFWRLFTIHPCAAGKPPETPRPSVWKATRTRS